MSRAADYFGLVAYMFVMYGGLPGSDSLWSDTLEPARARAQRPKLKLVASNDNLPPSRKRRSASGPSVQEAAA